MSLGAPDGEAFELPRQVLEHVTEDDIDDHDDGDEGDVQRYV